MLRDSLEAIDRMLCESSLRRRSWSIEAHHTKTLTTSLGDVTFRKTLFLNKQTKERSYLLDHILGLEPNQRLTEDAVARMLEEAVQTSYQRGAQQVSLSTQVSRQTVKNKLHSLEFPPSSHIPEQKKMVDWLYIDADEDHVALQFREKKGDLTKAENGVKNNGLITKMVCVYEGKEEDTFHGRRRVLTNRHCFCGVNRGEANLKFWDDIYQYLERNYDLEQVKKIYLNADGGNWIKAGAKRLKGVTFVLDGFHLEKYLIKLVPHLKKKDRVPVLEELCKTIRNQTKRDFRELVEKQKKEMPNRNDSFERGMCISNKNIYLNIAGSFIIGMIAVLAMKTESLDSRIVLFLKVGICGGFTTFSSFALETTDLIKDGKIYLAVIYIVLSVTLGVLAVFVGQ